MIKAGFDTSLWSLPVTWAVLVVLELAFIYLYGSKAVHPEVYVGKSSETRVATTADWKKLRNREMWEGAFVFTPTIPLILIGLITVVISWMKWGQWVVPPMSSLYIPLLAGVIVGSIYHGLWDSWSRDNNDISGTPTAGAPGDVNTEIFLKVSA